jgi:hypothetical protein
MRKARTCIRYYYQSENLITNDYTWTSHLPFATYFGNRDYAEKIRKTLERYEELCVLSEEAANHWLKLKDAKNQCT